MPFTSGAAAPPPCCTVMFLQTPQNGRNWTLILLTGPLSSVHLHILYFILFKVLPTLWIRKEVLEKVTDERNKMKQSRNVEQTRILLAACRVFGWIQPSKAELLISRTLDQELHNLCTNSAANVQTCCVVTANTSGKSQDVHRRAALMTHAGRNHSLMKSSELWKLNYSAPWRKRQSGSCR